RISASSPTSVRRKRPGHSLNASAAPSATGRGPKSPPIASIPMRGTEIMSVVRRLGFARRDDLFALVVAAARADPVRKPGGAAGGGVGGARFAGLPGRAPFLAAGMRVTSLGNRHDAGPPGAGPRPRAWSAVRGALARPLGQLGTTLRAQARTILPTVGSH